MNKIDNFDLISGRNILINNTCSVRQPRLNDIRNIGYDEYQKYLLTISLDLDSAAELFEISVDEISQLDIFNLLIYEQSIRELLLKSLSFFICEPLYFDLDIRCFKILINNNTSALINKDNYRDICNAILQINCIETSNKKELKFSNEFARQKYEKILKGHKNSKKNLDMNLDNLIASVSTFHSSYNLLNIWDLTIYQLYDQFRRLNTKIQFDILSKRWAPIETETFEFELWHKNLKSESNDTL